MAREQIGSAGTQKRTRMDEVNVEDYEVQTRPFMAESIKEKSISPRFLQTNRRVKRTSESLKQVIFLREPSEAFFDGRVDHL